LINYSLSKLKNKANRPGPLLIAGPCSAETEDQVLLTAQGLQSLSQVDYFRAGVWKPRTRPNSFEGNGEIALPWLKRVQDEFNLPVMVEIASADHLERCLKYGIKAVWIGARTTVNPFTVQEIADALRGTDIPVLIKNPINPDLKLWIGAIERIAGAGVKEIAAIHRGFQSYDNTVYRYAPKWDIAIELMTEMPDLQVICDPSHITGKRSMIAETSQKAMDLGMHGLMIETHPDPDKAWSDASQQITPQRLTEIWSELRIRNHSSDDPVFSTELDRLRSMIDSIDEELLEGIAKRMRLIERVGNYKRDNNITIFQPQRLSEIRETRTNFGKKLKLEEEFIRKILKDLHDESIRFQTEILYSSKPTKQAE